MTPSAKKISNASEVPWNKIAYKSPAVKQGANAFVAGWLSNPWVHNIYHVQVPATYGTLQEQVDAALHGTSDGESDGFKNLEKGIGWYDNAMIDSGLWNNLVQSNEEYRAMLEQSEGTEAAIQDNGFTRVMSEIRTASVGGNHEPASYNNNYSGTTSKIKQGAHPKLLVVSPEFITRLATSKLMGLGFDCVPAGNGVNALASMGKTQPVGAADCAIRCESGLLETLCRCPTDQDIASSFFVGLGANQKGLIAPQFALTGAHGSVKVVLPVNSMPVFAGESEPIGYQYLGYAKKTASIKVLLEGKKLVLDGDKENAVGFERINTILSNLPENTLGIRLNAKDITNDADLVNSALNSSDKPLDAAASLIKVVVPSNTKNGDIGSETMMTLEEYHKRIKDHFNRNDADSSKPSRTLSFTLLGTYFDINHGGKNLKNYLSAESGLTGFNIGFGAEGLSTTFTFQTKPKVLPKLEATMNKIGPTIWKSWYN